MTLIALVRKWLQPQVPEEVELAYAKLTEQCRTNQRLLQISSGEYLDFLQQQQTALLEQYRRFALFYREYPNDPELKREAIAILRSET